jgi:hypothetical protein
VTDDQVERVIVSTLEEMPRGATHWSRRGMAKASGLGRTTVQQIWRAFGLQLHRSETFKLSTDPLLIEKVRDIVGLYMQPPTHAVVFCVGHAEHRLPPSILFRGSRTTSRSQAERLTFDSLCRSTTPLPSRKCPWRNRS